MTVCAGYRRQRTPASCSMQIELIAASGWRERRKTASSRRMPRSWCAGRAELAEAVTGSRDGGCRRAALEEQLLRAVAPSFAAPSDGPILTAPLRRGRIRPPAGNTVGLVLVCRARVPAGQDQSRAAGRRSEPAGSLREAGRSAR